MSILTKIILAISVLGFIVTTLAWYHASVKDAGYQEAVAVYEKKLSDLNAEHAIALQTARDRALARTAALEDQVSAIDQRRIKEKQNADAAISILQRDVASGARRLSVPAANRTPLSAGTSRNSAAPAAGTVDQARCELDPTFASALVRIAADGDDAIRERNAVVEMYQAVTCEPAPAANEDAQ